MSLIVDSIFTEWRASLPEGSVCPNTKNGYHLFLLKEICLKRGIPENVINSVLLMLEKEETYKLKKKDTGEISVFTNKDNYEKALDSGDYEEPEGGEEEPQTKKPKTNPLFQKDGNPDDNLIKTGSSKETKDNEEKDEKPKGTPVEIKVSSNDKEKAAKVVEKVDNTVKELEGELENTLDGNEREDKEGEIDRLKVLKKNWDKFANAETEEERVEAVREMVDLGLLARNSPGQGNRKIYLTDMVSGLGAKDSMLDKKGVPKQGTPLTQLMSDVIDREGMEVDLRNSSADRTLAKVSGDHNEAGVCAFLDPSELNETEYNKVKEKYSSLGGDERRANKQNQAAAEKVREYLSKMNPPCEVEKAEAMGHLGNQQIRDKYGIDPKVNPTDFFVYCKDGTRKGISAKIYSNPKNITMKNSGTTKASANYLGDPSIDDNLNSLKEKYNIGNNPTKSEKSDFKTEYLRSWDVKMAELAKTPEGQQRLSRMWNEVHGCGEDVATLVTNKKSGEVQLHDPDHYCDPEPPLKVKYDGTKIVVNFGKDDQWVEMVCKTEKNGGVVLLFMHRTA